MLSACTTTETPVLLAAAPQAMAPMEGAALSAAPELLADLPEADGALPVPSSPPVNGGFGGMAVAMVAPAAGQSFAPAPAAAAQAFAPAPAAPEGAAAATPPAAVPAPEPLAPEKVAPVTASARERECLMRAMYFESNRSSPDGLLAVGTVVMHRVASGAWGKSICSVVGAKRQFAPGVLTRKMQGDLSDLQALADRIIAGKRHPKLAKNVMFFHVAGMKFPYKNMRYVLVAGGNTFYYKAGRARRA